MAEKQVTIGNALFTKTQQQVLRLLFGQPERSFYTQEIVRLAGVGIGTVQRELVRLSEVGLVTVSAQGNQKHYQANPASPIFAELRGIVVKTFGIADVLKEALLPFENKVKMAFIYGSVAKGGETARSDIDLMVISSKLSYTALMEQLVEVETQLGRPINPTVYSPAELRRKLDDGNAFLKRVLQQPKIVLMGEVDDLTESKQSGKD